MSMSSWLSNISWRKKIFIVIGGLLITCLFVGVIGGGAAVYQAAIIEKTIETSQVRVDVATKTQFAISELNHAVQAVTLASDESTIRKEAVASIRAGSAIDENLQKLKDVLGGEGKVNELITTLAAIRPHQMTAISAARSNNKEKANEELSSIAPEVTKVATISSEIVETERANLKSTIENIYSHSLNVAKIIGITVLAVILLGVVIGIMFSRNLVRALVYVEGGMMSLSHGDLNVAPLDFGRDELGRTAAAMSKTIQHLNTTVGTIRKNADAVSGAALGISKSSISLDKISTNLSAQVGQINNSADVVIGITKSTSANLTEFYENGSQTSEMVNKSVSKISSVVDKFLSFQNGMENTAADTRELAEIAKKITGITKSIADISSKTNLLALNAAIEAARAGEQGRGFAVVADEVRGLAETTKNEVHNISSLVESIAVKVNTVLASLELTVKESGKNIEELKNASVDVSEASGKVAVMLKTAQSIADLMGTQRESIHNVADSITYLREVASHTNSSSTELHAFSDNLAKFAAQLGESVAEFKLKS